MTKTSSKERQELKDLGFVRVDGMEIRDCLKEGRKGLIEVPTNLGRWDYNNGLIVVVTISGEVWLGSGAIFKGNHGKMEALLMEVSPNGQGAFVPCSNGESLRWSDLLGRMADPDCSSR